MQGPTCELPTHKLSPIEMWNGNKRLQTLVADVAQDTITIRSLDWVRAWELRSAAAAWLVVGGMAGVYPEVGTQQGGHCLPRRLQYVQDRDRFDIEFSLVEVRCPGASCSAGVVFAE